MTLLFILSLALLIAAAVDRWNRRPVLVVSTADEATYRGRRGFSLRFTLVAAELVAGDRSLPGVLVIPRNQIVLIQVLPVEARAPEPA